MRRGATSSIGYQWPQRSSTLASCWTAVTRAVWYSVYRLAVDGFAHHQKDVHQCKHHIHEIVSLVIGVTNPGVTAVCSRKKRLQDRYPPLDPSPFKDFKDPIRGRGRSTSGRG